MEASHSYLILWSEVVEGEDAVMLGCVDVYRPVVSGRMRSEEWAQMTIAS